VKQSICFHIYAGYCRIFITPVLNVVGFLANMSSNKLHVCLPLFTTIVFACVCLIFWMLFGLRLWAWQVRLGSSTLLVLRQLVAWSAVTPRATHGDQMATTWGQMFCIMSGCAHEGLGQCVPSLHCSWYSINPEAGFQFSMQKYSSMLMRRPPSHTISHNSQHFRTIVWASVGVWAGHLRTILQVSKRRGADFGHAVTICDCHCSFWKDLERSCWMK